MADIANTSNASKNKTHSRPTQMEDQETIISTKPPQKAPLLLEKQEGLTWANISSQLQADEDEDDGNDIALEPGDSVSARLSADLDDSRLASSAQKSSHHRRPSSAMGSPTVSRLPKEDMKIFGSEPMSDELVLIQCKGCGKPLLPSSFAHHAERCPGWNKSTALSDKPKASLNSRPLRQQPSSPTKLSVQNTDMKESDSGSQNAAPQKSAYREPAPGFSLKRKKQSDDLNLDIQCGVMTPSGKKCTRPLSCQIHTMMAKAAVSGRSKEFHLIFEDYKNNLELKLHMKPIETSTTKPSFESPINITFEEKFTDQDKDIYAIVDLIQRNVSKPLHTIRYIHVRRQTQSLRMRDLFMKIFVNKTQQQKIASQMHATPILSSAGVSLPNQTVHLQSRRPSANSVSVSNGSQHLDEQSTQVSSTTVSPKKKAATKKRPSATGLPKQTSEPSENSGDTTAAPSPAKSRPKKPKKEDSNKLDSAKPSISQISQPSAPAFVSMEDIQPATSVNPADLMGRGSSSTKIDPREFKFI